MKKRAAQKIAAKKERANEMNTQKINAQQIEAQVHGLLEQSGYFMRGENESPYVDIVDFVQKLGFVVGTAELPDDEDGFLMIRPVKMISAENDDNFALDRIPHERIIGVNSKRPLEWKRFIIAHEFAHSILHYQQGQVYLHRENKKGKDAQENEADYFAAALLMPRETFKREYQRLKDSGLNENAVCFQLSSIFNVQAESVSRRIEEINDLQTA